MKEKEIQSIFHSCTMHLDTTESFIYPTDAQLDCSKNALLCRVHYTHTNKDWINMESLDQTESLNNVFYFNPLKPELIPICYLLALLGAHHFLHVGRIRVKLLTFRLLMSYIYGAPILDVSRSHTTTQLSR